MSLVDLLLLLEDVLPEHVASDRGHGLSSLLGLGAEGALPLAPGVLLAREAVLKQLGSGRSGAEDHRVSHQHQVSRGRPGLALGLVLGSSVGRLSTRRYRKLVVAGSIGGSVSQPWLVVHWVEGAAAARWRIPVHLPPWHSVAGAIRHHGGLPMGLRQISVVALRLNGARGPISSPDMGGRVEVSPRVLVHPSLGALPVIELGGVAVRHLVESSVVTLRLDADGLAVGPDMRGSVEVIVHVVVHSSLGSLPGPGG
mmetsp:Transcript_27837/g.43459  ORF Transcript_27837/g.43459 Transcript_27837/m.43459 type:complete len:255 (-) Transcript_27837:119-883(-)